MGRVPSREEHLENAIASMILSAIVPLMFRMAGPIAGVRSLSLRGPDSVAARLSGPGSQAGQ